MWTKLKNTFFEQVVIPVYNFWAWLLDKIGLVKKIEEDPKMGDMFITVLKRLDVFIQDWDVSNMLEFHLNRVNKGTTNVPITNDDWRSCIPEAQLQKIDAIKGKKM